MLLDAAQQQQQQQQGDDAGAAAEAAAAAGKQSATEGKLIELQVGHRKGQRKALLCLRRAEALYNPR